MDDTDPMATVCALFRCQTVWTTMEFIEAIYRRWDPTASLWSHAECPLPPVVVLYTKTETFCRAMGLDASCVLYVHGIDAAWQPMFYHAVLRTGCRVVFIEPTTGIPEKRSGRCVHRILMDDLWMCRDVLDGRITFQGYGTVDTIDAASKVAGPDLSVRRIYVTYDMGAHPSYAITHVRRVLRSHVRPYFSDFVTFHSLNVPGLASKGHIKLPAASCNLFLYGVVAEGRRTEKREDMHRFQWDGQMTPSHWDTIMMQ